MTGYFKDSDGKESFTIKEAKKLTERLNKISAKFGMRYKVERCSMTMARIIKEANDGGIISKRKPKLRIKKRSKKC